CAPARKTAVSRTAGPRRHRPRPYNVRYCMHNKITWSSVIVLAVVVGGLNAMLVVPQRVLDGDEAGERATFGDAALRQRLQMARDVNGRIVPDALMRAKTQADRMRARRRLLLMNQAPVGSADRTSMSALSSAIASGAVWRWLGPN